MLTGKTRSAETLLAFRASLMSSFRWPLNCFNCTFSSFGVKACSPSWGKKRGRNAKASRNSGVCMFSCCLRAQTLAPTIRRSPKEAACYCRTASIKQEKWRHPPARRSKLVQPSTQIDVGRGGTAAGGLPGSGTMETIPTMRTTLQGKWRGCTYH